VDLVEDASFIEKLAQLRDLHRVRIYPQYEQTFVSTNCEYIFLACSLEVVDMSFLFEFVNSIQDKCGLLFFHVFHI
jgi:hypothetical protein